MHRFWLSTHALISDKKTVVSFCCSPGYHRIWGSEWVTPTYYWRLEQNGSHCVQDIFKCILLNGIHRILIQILQNFTHKSPTDKSKFVKVMAWCCRCGNPSTGSMMQRLSWDVQGSFCECAQPMRDDITLMCYLSLAGSIHKKIPDVFVKPSPISANICLLLVMSSPLSSTHIYSTGTNVGWHGQQSNINT